MGNGRRNDPDRSGEYVRLVSMTRAELREAIERGDPVNDEEFDAYLAPAARAVAARFWSPVRVAMLAARWLREEGAQNVVDVGAGTGKFCVVAALAEPSMKFLGIEHRASLVQRARDLATGFAVGRHVFFIEADARTTLIHEFDAIYLFNPFGENMYPLCDRFDDEVELSVDRMHLDVAAIELGLTRMRPGALLLTYHGFGGSVPDTFELTRETHIETDSLQLWVKRR
jgi:SAM-dependent methyltransferase